MGHLTDETKGVYNKGVGKIKEEVGDATDNRNLEMEGRGQHAKGEVQDKVADVKKKLGDDI